MNSALIRFGCLLPLNFMEEKEELSVPDLGLLTSWLSMLVIYFLPPFLWRSWKLLLESKTEAFLSQLISKAIVCIGSRVWVDWNQIKSWILRSLRLLCNDKAKKKGVSCSVDQYFNHLSTTINITPSLPHHLCGVLSYQSVIWWG